jgi:hypothetical protein
MRYTFSLLAFLTATTLASPQPSIANKDAAKPPTCNLGAAIKCLQTDFTLVSVETCVTGTTISVRLVAPRLYIYPSSAKSPPLCNFVGLWTLP